MGVLVSAGSLVGPNKDLGTCLTSNFYEMTDSQYPVSPYSIPVSFFCNQ
jgi:hypothetical protein